MKIENIHFETIDSTNTWVKNHAHELDPSGITCVTADEQTAGRGRYHRTWISPKNQNITATLYFCIEKGTPYVGNIPQILALCCVRLLKDLGIRAQIKWPNDILAEGKKIAGILCEVVDLQKCLGIVLGIGLNVNMNEEVIATIDQPATSLFALTGKTHNKKRVLKHLVQEFVTALPLLQKEGFAPFYAPFSKALAFQGEEVTFFNGVKTVRAILQGLTEQGHLLLVLPSGKLQEVSSGEIVFS